MSAKVEKKTTQVKPDRKQAPTRSAAEHQQQAQQQKRMELSRG
jgi:hypothetical protein